MGAAKKIALAGTKNQPFEGTGNFSATPARNNPPVGIGSGLAKGVQKKAATDAFRSNDKSTQKGKGPTKRTLPPKPPEDRMSIMPFPELAPGGVDKVVPKPFVGNKGPEPINKPVAPPSLMGPPGHSGIVTPNYGESIGDAPKDDYFAEDRFNKLYGAPAPDGWVEDRRMQAKRNYQRNAAENRMRGGRGGFKGGRR